MVHRLPHLPNILTFSRIAAIPLIMFFFYYPFYLSSLLTACLFALACLTDYFDGYLARTYQNVSRLGAFLDPVADKILVAVTLLMLTDSQTIQGISIIPAALILSREMMVSGLREFLAALQASLPVSRFSKWKTGIQMLSLGLLLASREVALPDFFQPILFFAGIYTLWVSAFLTVMTGYNYIKACKVYFVEGSR
ncbi:MAG: CDP-diacylglycerol--glycerol-3-phosphate 3-phosphatidyltransferase [Alphaproteobacteria bacterium]